MEYIRRIIDDELNKRMEAFNAINIIGPKGCGKTRTAKERCKTIIEFQDEEKRDGYLTGSSSKKVEMPHTGTGRITEITMFPMTLWETGESNRIGIMSI